MNKQDRWKGLSLSEKSDLMRVFIENGITDLKDMQNQYNSIEPAEVTADYPRRNEVFRIADESNAPFIDRAKDVNRQTIQDWENPENVATHKMSWTGADGKYYAYPNVQSKDGKLHDYTNPKNKHDEWDAFKNALRNKDVVRFDTPGDARYFTEHYKDYYEGFNQYGEGGPKKERYPEVTIKEEPWADTYFRENPNVAGMAIGAGMNDIEGPRRVIYNPYNEAMRDSTQRAGLLLNERLRHYMDETNYTPTGITKKQIDRYVGTPYQNDTLNIGRTEAARYLTGDRNLLTPEQKVSADSLYNEYNKFSKGGKIHIKKENEGKFTASAKRAGMGVQEFAKHVMANKDDYSTTQIRRANFARNASRWHDDGGPLDEGGYSTEDRKHRERVQRRYDPTGYIVGQPISQGLNYLTTGKFNPARGEENEYWKAYLGLPNAVPPMRPESKTEWDDIIENRKKEKGEPLSDFYGTTPRIDVNVQAIADTLNLGNIVRNYDEVAKRHSNMPPKWRFEDAYKVGKQVLDNPGEWQQVPKDMGIYPVEQYYNENNALGMFRKFGMKWVPEEGKVYMHDTYDFPEWAYGTVIPRRPKEMKVRGAVNFNPKKGSYLLRNDMEYFNKYDYPEALTSK